MIASEGKKGSCLGKKNSCWVQVRVDTMGNRVAGGRVWQCSWMVFVIEEGEGGGKFWLIRCRMDRWVERVVLNLYK